MEEAKINTAETFVTKTYSMTLEQVYQIKAMAKELTAKEGKPISDAEVIRRAVPLLYAQVFPQP